MVKREISTLILASMLVLFQMYAGRWFPRENLETASIKAIVVDAGLDELELRASQLVTRVSGHSHIEWLAVLIVERVAELRDDMIVQRQHLRQALAAIQEE